jgi:multidrug efflux pump subunit AcrA (membrane-fusion protein)
MGIVSRLRRHPYALGSIALLIVVVGGGTLAVSRPWRSIAGAQGVLPAPPRAPVVVAPARTRDVGVYLNGLGAVTPLNTVTVRTRVDGELIGVRFQEGQIVSRGDLLAEIDPRPFEAQLTQFQGQLERDQGLLDNARLDLERFQELVKTDAVPRQHWTPRRRSFTSSRARSRTIRARSTPRRSSLSTVASPRPSPAGWGSVWWTPATSCTPPIRAGWSSSPNSSRSP